MKVSLNTVKQFTKVDLPVDQLVSKINQQLGGVEEVIDLKAKYQDAKIVRVMECDKHPNADRLNVCKIDAGTGELIQVVCGAPNAKADMWAVWLPPKSTVPSSFDDDQPFVLESRQLRGVVSNGMLASARELALGDDHDGIVELNQEDLRQGELAPGAGFAETFGLDDVVIDIENKMFTHRPDLFGQLGVAREIAGIQHQPFSSPDWYRQFESETVDAGDVLPLEVFNQAGDKAPRFIAAVIKNVSVGPSPMWLRCALAAMGSKSINNIVDITNYVMLMTAQPTHAYDYDRLRGAKLGVRMAEPDEQAVLLNGKSYHLDQNDIVIVDGEGVVGLGGIMGGGNSEVSSDTKNIVLEVANFNMYAVRKTSMRHGLFTDALTRFNKGQSPLQNDRVLARLIAMVRDLADGELASSVFDAGEKLAGNQLLTTTVDFINDRLGLQLSSQDIKQLLENVELEVEIGQALSIRPPFWRTDIEVAEDVVEEIGRLYGFDKLPRQLPQRSTKPPANNQARLTAEAVRSSLARSGANEVLTYSFVHENILKKSQQDVDQAYKLSNALSPDLQYYRLSVLPSLLDKVHMNIKAGHDEFSLFEIGKTHNKLRQLNHEGLPSETRYIDVVYASKQRDDSAAFYTIRRMVDQLADDLNIKLVYKKIDKPVDSQVTAAFDLDRSAVVQALDGQYIGIIGELKQTVMTNFKLPNRLAAATLDFDSVDKLRQASGNSYQPLSKYPRVSQDLSIKVSSDTSYDQLESVVSSAIRDRSGDLSVKIAPLTIYQAESSSSTKTVTFRVTVTSFEATLTDEDVSQLLSHAGQAATEALDAVIS